MELINLPNGEKLVTNWNLNDIEEVVQKFCGDEFTTGLLSVINDLQSQSDYNKLKFNSDFEAYEWENGELREALCDIEQLLQQYKHGLEKGKEPFSRKRVYKLFEEIRKEVENVI